MQLTSEAISQLRNREELSQKEFAKILGCSRTRLSRIESGLLALSQFEWLNLIQRYPLAASFETINTNLSEFPRINSLQRYTDKAFVSPRFGIFLDQYMHVELGKNVRDNFWDSEKLSNEFSVFSKHGFPFDLILRMIQWLILHGHLKNEQEIATVAKTAINSKFFWGRKWNWFLATESSQRLIQFLENWQSYSNNHHIAWSEDEKSELITITLSPQIGICKKLYFNDLILKDFTGTWAKWWWHYFLNEQFKVQVLKKEDAWVIKITKAKLH